MIIKEVKKLREKVTENWSFIKPPKDTKEFAKELIEAMWSNSGLGISANQLGYNYRVFAIDESDELTNAFFKICETLQF